MNLRELAKNASIAFLAQGVAMCVSVVTTLLVPKVLGVEQYGYWQLFIFYSTYVGFCHLGLNDGVYLVHGGESRIEINKQSINSQMLVGFTFQLLLAVAALLFLVGSDMGGDRSFILGCTALYMVVKNTALYLGYVFQAINETKLYSFSCILERVCFLAPLLLLLLLQVKSFESYVLAYLVSGTVQLLFCLWFARDFLSSGVEPTGLALNETVASIRIGIRLMLANIASQLVLGIARFAIDAAWGIETFGKLSLSLSMVNFFLAFVSQASMVLFPALRQGGGEDQRRFYRASRDGMSLVFPLVYLLYFPLRWILSAWLPAYADSMTFFIFLLPICVFDIRMNISCTTLFKVRREEKTLFAVNVVTTLISAAGTLVGIYILRSVYSVIFAVAVAITARSMFSEWLLSRRVGVEPGLGLSLGELLLTGVFIGSTLCLDDLPAIAIFSISYALFLLVNKDAASEMALRLGRVSR